MYEEFVQKFSSNPAAAAYGDWQLAQAYQTAGDLQKSLEYGDKALAGIATQSGYFGVAGGSGATGEEQRQADGLCREGRRSLRIRLPSSPSRRA